MFANGFDAPTTSAFYVSPAGLDTNAGSAAAPFLTITKGIAAAAADPGKPPVFVANGVYNESITLASGVSVFGQYHAGTWVLDPTSYSIIDGVASQGNNDRTVDASNVGSLTAFDRFVVFGSDNTKAGGNSYAIYVSNSSANLELTNNVIFAGHGGPGADGATSPAGSAGVGGSGRSPNLAVADAAYDSKDASAGSGECDVVNNRQYSNGGALSCGGTPVNGGDGGGNRCPVKSFCDIGDPNFGCLQSPINFHWNEYTGIDGMAGIAGGGGGGTAGAGAFAGDDMIQVYAPFYSGYICFLPTDTDGDGSQTYGLNGSNGGNGADGAGVVGCTAATGSVIGVDWIGGSAPAGNVGDNGGGGGGGGAGGGGKCQATAGHTTCTDGGGKDTLGAHGGGGGSGGCGGDGGGGGGSGGGAFGIFIVGGVAPVVTGNTVFGGSGGGGGAGGNGATGGSGGLGALGGSAGVPFVFCTDAAGRGGNGGAGGYGAGGGGGCGGASFGIYTSGIGTPDYCTSNAVGDGSAGAGGTGGLSRVNPGGAGQAGVEVACSFN
jgi:hypothetical protein